MNYNFHPPLSSVPAVLFAAALFFEALGRFFRSRELRFAGTAIFLLASALLPVTYFSGLWNEELLAQTVRSRSGDLISRHEALARLSLFVLALPIFFRSMEVIAKSERQKKVFSVFYFLSLFALFSLIAVTSYLGGSLVFEEGVGVRSI